MEMLPILERYQAPFRTRYADRLQRNHHRALDAMLDCRTARFGEMHHHHQSAFHACGHRSCPRCQHHVRTLPPTYVDHRLCAAWLAVRLAR